jgi:ubiquinone/menaquinone biosynthesis C-methylase UbiE
MGNNSYIHGTSEQELNRLLRLNLLTNPAFLRYVELEVTDQVLELGSGLGILAAEMAKKNPLGRIVGVEISAEMLKRCPQEVPNLSFRQADVQQLPFEEESFDVVYCRYVLEHIQNPGQVLAEARRVMRTGGHIFLQENNNLAFDFYPECRSFMSLWKSFVVLQEKLGGDALIGKKLYWLLRQAGFNEIELSFATEIHTPEMPTFPHWIDNLLDNILGAADKLMEHKMASREEIQAALDQMVEFRANPMASTYFYWNRARAVK